jgi:hypothetical protein
VFKRRGSDAPDVLDQSATDEVPEPARPGVTAAKGRPTPKRSEVEKQRRQPFGASATQKGGASRSRDAGRGDRGRRMEAMRRGEDWALPRKDQGPVRALARDVVDSRRGFSEYYLYGIVLLLAALFIPQLRGTAAVDVVVLAVLLIISLEGWWVGRRVVRLAQERYPGESVRGVRMYATLRGTQIRKMRVPSPRVQRGARI